MAALSSLEREGCVEVTVCVGKKRHLTHLNLQVVV